jgi:lysophospholipase L1-like esterase
LRNKLFALATVIVAVMALGAGNASARQAGPAQADCAVPDAPRPTAAAGVKVWLAGDSTMADPRTTCPVGWGNQFDALFDDRVTVVNNAVAGRSVQTWLYESNVKGTADATGECVVSPQTYAQRWLTMLDPTAGMRAGDYLIVQFGINDGDRACPRHVGSARYRQLLGVIARAAKDRGVRPIFVTPVAAITCSGSTAVGNRGFVAETFAAGSADQIPVIDLHKLSTALYNTLKLCPNNGDYTQGAVGAFFCDDHTHFEAAGARRIAEVVATALRNQQIGLASYLK